MNDAGEAAEDILRLAALAAPEARSVRVYRSPEGAPRLKIYRHGGPVELSDAVPVLENFGFRVIEEVPSPLDDEHRGFVHDFRISSASVADADLCAGDTSVLEGAMAAVLEGHAEDDAFNRLTVEAGMKPGSVVLFRAWFRYLRQAGLSYGLTTVVAALRRPPHVATALVARFEPAPQPPPHGAPPPPL